MGELISAGVGLLLALGFWWVTGREMAGKSWLPGGRRRFSRNGRPIHDSRIVRSVHDRQRIEILIAGGDTCHACDDARPGEMIDVLSQVLTRNGVVVIKHNRRYCVDRPACREAVVAMLAEIRREDEDFYRSRWPCHRLSATLA